MIYELRRIPKGWENKKRLRRMRFPGGIGIGNYSIRIEERKKPRYPQLLG